MEKHPPQEPTLVPDATPTPGVSRKVVVRRWVIGIATAGVVGWGLWAVSDFLENLGGGPVRSAADFRKQDIRTREAGRQTIGDLRPGVGRADWMREVGSTSCVDDLGFDGDGVTRKQPGYTWELRYATEAGYRADLDKLRAAWEHRGWKTDDKPPHEPLNSQDRTPRWPGITTTDDHGVTITMGVDEYTGKPGLWTDGGCVRYNTEDRVSGRKHTGAAAGGGPGREGTITYDDGVRVSIGPVESIKPTPEMTGGAAPAAYTYRVPVTVTNRSGAPVELRSHDIGGYEGANPGVERLTSYPSELAGSEPHLVSEGDTTRLEFVYTARTKPSHLELVYAPGGLHASYTWKLSIP
ncbi:hypothetical protein [Streptomyces triculaminicus]|uniref:hypothetical protein n=1 Tax=Streptomyces triculaminicus TaxID=2816232 RepID=UPI003795824A